MNNKPLIGIIGGDMRQVYLARGLGKQYDICTAFLEKAPLYPTEHTNGIETIKNADILIFPLPISADGIHINAAFSEKDITIDEVFRRVSPNSLVLAGRVTDEIAKKASEYGFSIIDYFEREELSVLNAIPTAEGAIQIAMEELPITIHGSKALITGCGRISRVLMGSLRALGADVTACARRLSDLAWINVLGSRPITFAQLRSEKIDADVIFNTVPAVVFDEYLLKKLPPETLIIDLASKPGGAYRLIAQ